MTAFQDETPSTPRLALPAIRRRLLLGAAVSALAAGPGRAQSPPPKPKGQVIVGLSQEPTVFNPLMPAIEVDQGVWFNLFNPLWSPEPDGTMVPQLATEVPTLDNGGISKDGLTWTVKLRPDVTWHDGTPFTAEDVKFTLALLANKDFRANTRQGHELVQDATVTGPHEITWRMSKPYAPYVSLLSWTFMVPKHVLEKAADPNTAPFNNAPVGTGPFRWAERVPGDHLTLVANERYFGKGPFLERVVFKYIPDLTVMFTQFKTGAIDHTGIQGILASFYGEAKALPGRQVLLTASPQVEAIAVNMGNPVLADKAVRQALYGSINKQAIADIIYYGLPKPTESFYSASSWAFAPNLPRQKYDPAAASALLDGAGWKRGSGGVREKDGRRLEFDVSTTAGNPLREQVQQLLQQDWLGVGAAMKINNMPAAVIWGDFYQRSKFTSVLVSTTYGTGNDPDCSIRFGSGAIPVQGGSGNNYYQYKNPAVDAAIAEGLSSFDQAARKAAYQKVQSLVRDDLVVMPLYEPVPVQGLKAGLMGFRQNVNVQASTWNMSEWYWAA